MRRTATETREHVLKVANDLFYWQGIHATGVDRVAADAGIAPTTLYRLFASKDDLVAAYVERAGQFANDRFTATMDAAGADPRARVLAIFDGLVGQVQPDGYRGCACLMTLAEYPDAGGAVHEQAVGAKRWIHARFTELAEAIGAADPAALADDLILLHEGVLAATQSLDTDRLARRARVLAEKILDLA
jgi:AcrR family transcriptional regulator